MTKFLEIRNLAKSFGDVPVLQGLELALAEGEILALLGLSGSGKTTALRLLAGFEVPDRGAILVDGEDVTRVPPARRGFGMVFQHYALFPHMTVFENVAFGLRSQGWRKGRIGGRVGEVLGLVDLRGFEKRKVSEISGGQQQRVAVARALAPEPRVLLLDEPLSNLDPSLRERTRRELRDAVRSIGITTVLVTHEQEEAFDVGDRVAVLNAGRLEQVGSPEELYRRPRTRFVATFIGRSGTVRGIVEEDCVGGERGGECRVALGESRVALGEDTVRWPGVAGEELRRGQAVDLVVKPESLRLASSREPGAMPGRVIERRFTGALTYAVVRISTGEQIEVLDDTEAAEVGAQVFVTLRGEGPRPRVFAESQPSAVEAENVDGGA